MIIKEIAKQILNYLGDIYLGFYAGKPGKRSTILIMDGMSEKNSALIDNYTFFEYLMSLDDCKYTPLYLVNSESVYANNIKKKYGDHVIEITKKHRIRTYLILAKLFKETRYVCQSFMAFRWLTFGADSALRKSKYIVSIFTQHGITFFKDKVISDVIYGSKSFDKIMISSPIEERLFIDVGKYDEDDLIKNGLFRWDAISETKTDAKNTIFVFFTYRGYLRVIDDIHNTVYIKSIEKLLNDDSFLKVVKKYNIEVKVGVHHSIAEKRLFNDISTSVVVIGEEDIARVKKEAKVLITDCSSMCFEFMRIGRKVLFYDLEDEEECKRYNRTEDRIDNYEGKLELLSCVSLNVNGICMKIDEIFGSGISDDIVHGSLFYYNDGFCERFYRTLLSIEE